MMFFIKSVYAQPLGSCIPYSVLYGDNLIYDLKQKPLLASLEQNLADSDLLGNIPSFSLFQQSTQPLYYPNGNTLVSFEGVMGSGQGVQNIFYENGNLFTSISFNNNLISGTQKIYYDNIIK